MKKLLSLVAGILTGVVFTVLSTFNVGAWDNGLAKTPPMGWNSWNIFHGDINETKIKQIADTMVSCGMKDAGYVYLNLDDNWMANPARDANGNLKADPTRFPSGMKALSDYVHAKGLKLGIYGDRGTMTCMNVPQSGSKGYEEKDAKTFASWGIDYLKYDNCNIPNGSDMKTDYKKMQTALANCGRPIVFSICAWEYQSWMPETGNLWRTTRDITDKWDTGTSFFRGIINLIDENAKYTSAATPGAWNDPDMLEVGNGGCTTEEYRTQMSMWSMMASPLIAGNDIRTMSQTTKDLLLNKEIIAVDQDPAGIQGSRVKSSNGLEIWVKPLGTDGTTKAVALLNRNSATSNITVNWSDIGLSGSISVRDLWAKADKGSFTGSYTASVPSHGTVMLKVTSAPPTPVDGFKRIEAENYNNQFGIEIEDNTNDNGRNIGYIQNGDYTVYKNVDFGDGATSFKASAGSNSTGGNIEIHLDSLTGTLIGTCAVPNTGGWKTWTDVSCNISKVSGKHDVYLKFTGESEYLLNLNWFTFAKGSVVTGKLGDINSDDAVDSLDFMLIKKHLLGLESVENKLLADLDASGEADSIDFALMKQYLLGIITGFPVSGNTGPVIDDDPTTPGEDNPTTPIDGDITIEPNGSISLQQAINSIKAGKTIYLKGGTYSLSKTVSIAEGNNGSVGSTKNIVALANEKPVLDFSAMAFDASNRGLVLAGNYWNIKGIKIQKAGDNGMLLAGNNNIIDSCEFYANKDSGLQISRFNSAYNSIATWPSNNTVKNCYSHSNYDPDNGEDADGFAAKLTCGNGNKFIGCISKYNVDDGWDLYTKTETGAIGSIYFEDCEASYNGKTEDGVSTTDSDGNGFKLGGSKISVDHTLKNCKAFNNKKHGFTWNSNPGKLTLTGCQASGNGVNDFEKVTNN